MNTIKEENTGTSHDASIIASLVQAITELFRSANDLCEELKRKQTSETNNKRRRRLLSRRRDDSSSSSSDSSDSGGTRKKRGKKSGRNDRIGDSDIDQESSLSFSNIVRVEYERGYDKYGERFAVGDLLAQNQLQAQVIALQGAIIKCYQLQDLLPPAELLLQLRQASRSARTAGVNALVDMHGRIVADRDDDHATPDIPGMFPKVYFTARHPTMRDCATTSGNRGRSRSRRSKSGHGDSSSLSSRLFCPYALDLQRHLYQPLANTYHVGGSRCCPYCRFVFGTRPDKAWEIVLDDTRSGTGTKTFLIGDRFLVKCHREGGGLACVLCRRFKTHDTVCPEIADLVDHIWREHAVEEVEDDDDMREVQVT